MEQITKEESIKHLNNAYKILKHCALQNNMSVPVFTKMLDIYAGVKYTKIDDILLSQELAEIEENVVILTVKGKEFLKHAFDNFTTELKVLDFSDVQVPLNSHGMAQTNSRKSTSKPGIRMPNSNFLPIMTDKSSNLIKQIATTICPNGISGREIAKHGTYLKNPLLIPYYYLFLQIFPSKDRQENENWEKMFGSVYRGVTLRRNTKGTAAKFEEICRRHDVGIFLGSVIRHVVESKGGDGNYYPKSLENYFKEWDHWYNATLESKYSETKIKIQEYESNNALI